ncbi:serine hydrolase [Patescibacteria group bacterium]
MKQILPIFLGMFSALLIVCGYHVLSNFEWSMKIPGQPKPSSTMVEMEIPKLNLEPVKQKIGSTRGVFGLYIKHLKSGDIYEINPGAKFYAASLYKIPIAAAAYKQIELNKLVSSVSLDTSLDELLKHSDNFEQQRFVGMFGHLIIVDAFKLGNILKDTNFYHVNESTPKEIANYFEKLWVSDYLPQKYREDLFEKLSKTGFDDRIHLGLKPRDVFAHKIGNWPQEGSWHDCGILNKEIVVCLMSKNTTFMNFQNVAKTVGEVVSP